MIEAFLKRFKKVDSAVKTLQENVIGQQESIICESERVKGEIAELNKRIPEDKNKQFSEDLSNMKDILESLSTKQREILLQEPPKLQEPVTNIIKETTVIEGQPGEDGRGIEKIFINANKHWIVIYTDGTRVDLGKIISETIYQGGGGGGISIQQVKRLLYKELTYISAADSPYSIKVSDKTIIVDSSGGDVTINPIDISIAEVKRIDVIMGTNDSNSYIWNAAVNGESSATITIKDTSITFVPDKINNQYRIV